MASKDSFSMRGRFPNASLLSQTENLIILEKALEQNGQDWIENANTIEQLLVRIVDRIGKQDSTIKANFIIRRLPTYLSPFINKNEYGIVLEDLVFSLSPPKCKNPSGSPSPDRPGSVNFGQLEIYHLDLNEESDDDSLEPAEDKVGHETSARLRRAEIINENQAFCSHEIFKRFASAFVDAYHFEMECESAGDSVNLYKGKVQILAPHLLLDVKTTPEVDKIFSLMQPPLPMSKDTKSRCTVNVNYLKSSITVTYEDTEAIVRPCLYYSGGYPKVNAVILERLPLHHPSFLTCSESLGKGFLLIPTSFETLWTLQYWTAESHLISKYHPSSLICRVLKLYSAFCLNPFNFWETLNTSFLIGINEMDLFNDNSKVDLLSVDYVISSFIYELEDFSRIEDWAPRNFCTRLMHLVRSGVDSYEKGYHSHYFTRINVLRGIWKNGDHFDTEEKSVLRELDNITEDLDDYGERRLMEIDDLADDFGLHFDELDTFGEDDIQPRLTSETIYKSLNPFQTMENLPSCSSTMVQNSGSKKSKTLSKMLGSNLVKRISSKVSRRHSDAGNKSPLRGKAHPQDQNQSLTDIASGFEESIAQMRREESVPRQRVHGTRQLLETSFNEEKYSKILDNSDLPNRPIHSKLGSNKAQCGFNNVAFESSHAASVYAALLQSLAELPPSDYFSDKEIVAHLDRSTKILESQEELISSWGKAMNDLPKPKVICPHVFSPRQIQYLSLIIQSVSRCSPNMVKIVKISKIPAWEISGDILRTVLHQMRTDATNSDTLREKQRPKVVKSRSFTTARDQTRDEDAEDATSSKKSTKKFSLLRKPSNVSSCKHLDKQEDGFMRDGSSQDDGPQLALEEPEVAASLRLLEWLWQLRCSEMGRLSSKAQKYLEELYKISLINSHFLEQLMEESTFKALALRSAVAVTKIMADEKFPVHIPLYAASNKGWLWAEMILSLASWNKEKGIDMYASIPLSDPHPITNKTYTVRSINGSSSVDLEGTLRRKASKLIGTSEPDIDAATLAFHSELATPIGWNDFEEPRRSGPFTAVILIFSSMGYFKFWEMIPGNIVQALVRLQKFNSLQHVGTMLASPHRKTALNEVRKLNKSTSFRMYNFEENVMSKTFKRLASLRNTRRKLLVKGESRPVRKYSCEEAGCHNNNRNETSTSRIDGKIIECTKL